MSKSRFLKIITAGNAGVGKTTLLYRYVEGNFLTDTKATLGVDFYWKVFNAKDNQIDLQLWDFGGQQVFRHILKNYASGANGALLLFDLTNKSSLEQIDGWVDICRVNDPKLPIIFLGTKLDLTDLIIIEDAEAIFFKEKYGFLEYIKVSSKMDENVNLAFQSLVNEIMKEL
ncbi:MAG: Rab family GTPase [Promethearchaeota archaeon]|jgi:small GTP-binding protein